MVWSVDVVPLYYEVYPNVLGTTYELRRTLGTISVCSESVLIASFEEGMILYSQEAPSSARGTIPIIHILEALRGREVERNESGESSHKGSHAPLGSLCTSGIPKTNRIASDLRLFNKEL